MFPYNIFSVHYKQCIRVRIFLNIEYFSHTLYELHMKNDAINIEDLITFRCLNIDRISEVHPYLLKAVWLIFYQLILYKRASFFAYCWKKMEKNSKDSLLSLRLNKYRQDHTYVERKVPQKKCI